MAGYSTERRLLGGVSQTVGNSETNTPVSREYKISESDADNHLIRVKCSSTTGSPTIKLQHTWSVDDGFVDVSGATTTAADGTVEIATTGPIWPWARVVITTGGGDATTVDQVYTSSRS